MTLKRVCSIATGIVLSGFLGACAEGAGTLELTVDALPTFVRDSTVLITGNVTRTPAKAIDIIVSATGGVAPSADTLRGNRYEVRVRLNINATNQLTITATDATGSTSGSLNVSTRQDGEAPTITQMTPPNGGDQAARTTPIDIRFSEPIVLAPGGGVKLVRQGANVAGTNSLSADSMSLTFSPGTSLSPNAVYNLTFSGITDVAANAPTSLSACFVTSTTGATVSAAFPDEVNDRYYAPLSGSEPRPDTVDLEQARFAREGDLFSGVFRFDRPRSFSATAVNQVAILLDLDADQDSTTGVGTFKDSLFINSFDITYSSGIGSEFLVDIEPFALFGDSAIVGRYFDADSLRVQGKFVPGVCNRSVGFAFPFSWLEFANGTPEDGNLNAVVLTLAVSSSWAWIDPLPLKKNISFDLRAPGPAPPAAPVAAGYAVPSGPEFVRIRPRLFRIR